MTPGLPEILALVLGGGLVATVTGIAKAVAALRDGARARERDVIADTEAWRRSAEDARRCAEYRADWWRERAIAIHQEYVDHGGRPGPLGSPPRPPPPPSDPA